MTLTAHQWAAERLANSIRLAGRAAIADTPGWEGWLEDVGYWRLIVAMFEHHEVTTNIDPHAAPAIRQTVAQMRSTVALSKQLGTPVADHQLILDWVRQIESAIGIDESDRQLILLALAMCALIRPGFDDALRRIALKCDGVDMYDDFKRFYNDHRRDGTDGTDRTRTVSE